MFKPPLFLNGAKNKTGPVARQGRGVCFGLLATLSLARLLRRWRDTRTVGGVTGHMVGHPEVSSLLVDLSKIANALIETA